MTETPQPTSGSLSARLIRACRVHHDCALECPERQVEDLGEIASFDQRSTLDKIKESYLRWRHSSQP